MKRFIPVLGIAGLAVACSGNPTPDNTITTDSSKTSVQPKQPASPTWLGTWERNEWQNDASLEITGIKGDSIVFSLSAFSGGHNGELEGMAVVNGNTAVYLDETEGDTCLIRFRLMGDTAVVLDQQKGTCYAGMGVSYEGMYKGAKATKQVEADKSLTELGIFKTEEEDAAFRALVGDSYSLFINSTQLIADVEDLDNFGAIVHASGIRGLFGFMENIIMADAANNIWAAVLNDEKVYYYTNNEAYKEKLPKTIEHWRESFSNNPVIYQSKAGQ